MVWKRYINRTEAWAREVDDDVEEIVGSTGRATAYRGDVIVNQTLRGQNFTYILTNDDFHENWRGLDEVDTEGPTESETGYDELPGTIPPDEESDDHDAERGSGFGQSATVGTRDNPTPADTTDDQDAVPESPDTTPENAPPSPTASAPTGAGSGDAETPAGQPPQTPDQNPEPAMSPVSGIATPDTAVEAPAGSGASETTLEEGKAVEEATAGNVEETESADEPATTTPAATVTPASEPGGPGTKTADETAGQVETASPEEGGDRGATPTLTEVPESVETVTAAGRHADGDEEAPTGNGGEETGDAPAKNGDADA